MNSRMRLKMSLAAVLAGAIAVAVTLGASANLLAQPARDQAEAPLEYVLIVTGGELLRGEYADGHTFFITRTLRPLGAHCVGSLCVADDATDLQAALRFATNRAPLVIVTGGLGPTDDDITRQTLSAFTGIRLIEHPDVLAAMARRFGVPVNRLRANLRRQTQVPEQGRYLPNPNGTAVGLIFETERHVLVALPGPPRELQPMVRNELIPYLHQRFGIHPGGISVRLRFVGIGESQIDDVLKQRVKFPPGLTLSSLFERGRVDVSFFLPGQGPEDRARLAALKREVLAALGDYVYAEGDKTLEAVVLEALHQRGWRVAVAEVGSGGALTASLAAEDASKEVVAAAFVASSERELAGILDASREAAGMSGSGSTESGARRRIVSLAQAAARKAKCEVGLAIGEVRSAKRQAAGLWLAWAPNEEAEDTQVQFVRVGDRSQEARERLVTRILDWLRRRLAQKPAARAVH